MTVGVWLAWKRHTESSQARTAVRRIAVLPFENETADDRLTPLAAGFQNLITLQAAAPKLVVLPAHSVGEARAAGMRYLLHGAIYSRGDKSYVRAAMEDLAANSIGWQMTAELDSSDWRSAAAEVPAQLLAVLAPGSKPAASPSEDALRLLVQSWSETDTARKAALQEESIRKDEKCGWCWFALAQTKSGAGDRTGALALLDERKQRKPGIDHVSGLQLDLLEASLNEDAKARVQALSGLAALRPGDSSSLRSLAEVAQELRQNEQAEQAWRQYLAVEAGDAAAWNSFAYALAAGGKFDEALKAVGEYAKRDTGPNPADSKGEILFMAGRFEEAEKAFLESYRKDGNFNGGIALEKSALCRLLMDDPKGAAAAVGRYLEERSQKKDGLTAFHGARWEWLLGRRENALAGMQQVARPGGAAASIACAKLAVWSLEAGDMEGARLWAKTAAREAKNPGDQLAAAMSLLLVGSGEQIRGLDPALRRNMQALRLSLEGRFVEAQPIWQESLAQGRAGWEGFTSAMASWNALRAGNPQAAKTALGPGWPILSADQLWLFDSVVFQNAFFTRAALAQQGQQAETAQRLFDVYLRSMGGSAKDRFGQLAKARGEARL